MRRGESEYRANSTTEKYLLALKCLRAAASLEPENPTLHEQLIRFRLEGRFNPRHSLAFSPADMIIVDKRQESQPGKLTEALKSTSDLVPSASSLKSFNDSYLEKHKAGAAHVQCALNARFVLDPSSQAQDEKDLIATFDLPSATPNTAHDALVLLKNDWKSDNKVIDEGLAKARKRWPEATIFKEGRVLLV
jgi:N-alpha-acetyltransferase 15/16, NatA auxiliary subunit